MRRGSGAPIASQKRAPTWGGMIGSESAQRERIGRSSSRIASSTRRPAAAPGASGSVGSISGKARAPAFDTDISVENISRAGLAAIREVLERLGADAEYIVFGHTHRPGPLEVDGSGEWRLANGTHLHSTGSWAYSPGLCGPTPERSLFWPGTVTWVDDHGPPIRQELLHRRSRTELAAAVRRISAAGFPTPSTPKRKQLRL